MDLGLEILRVNGRMEVPLAPEYVRALTDADIALLSKERGEQKHTHLKRLTQRHHALARAIASGMKNWEAALACGYCESSVSILQRDPTFANLIQFYVENKDAEFRQVHRQMAAVALDVVDAIADDLDAGNLTPGQKLEAAKLFLDRTGHGPATTSNHKHEHTFNIADRVGAARKRLQERQVIDVTPQVVEDDDAA